MTADFDQHYLYLEKSRDLSCQKNVISDTENQLSTLFIELHLPLIPCSTKATGIY
ncbi:hypothetical protein AM1_0865 [Acaryochloris marina MBIC11017]|uniref:Uncharacterized protein n=1 Tax=Acaryochloris marina (strain MBIC 11017) TaxID=329726 RepID=B0BYM4_ACAM1|nr:hypothetical protein AM1_0865 [Acaryochloris marina MBIC11017]